MESQCVCGAMNSTTFRENWVGKQNGLLRRLAAKRGVTLLPAYEMTAARPDLKMGVRCIMGWAHCYCDWCARGGSGGSSGARRPSRCFLLP